MSSLLYKHRLTALLGAAVLATPLALSVLPGNQTTAFAQAAGGLSAPGGSYAGIVASDKPAVVTITSTMKADPNAQDGTASPFDEQFRQFFGQQGIPLPPQAQRPHAGGDEQIALGSGFVISGDGYIVTNNHVIDNAKTIKVTLDDGTELSAKLIGADPKSDLAVVKVSAPKPLTTVTWGDSDRLRAGDQILAIGNPFGIGTTVTAGIVSARGRDLHSGPYDDFIQIDAPINHGNSGGPLVDIDGKVVGINTAIYSPNGGSVGVGFAIPSDQAQKIVAKLMKDGSIQHGFIGVQIQPVTGDVANAVGLNKAEGALVAKVQPDTPAAKAGVHTGDVITALGSEPVTAPRDLSRKVADLSPGEKTKLTVWRDGASQDLAMTIGGNDTGSEQAAAEPGKSAKEAQVATIGVGLADITPDVREALNLPRGESGAVIESVAPSKPAADAGLQTGDVIVSVNQAPVKSAKDARTAIAEAGKSGRKSVLLLVQRGDEQTFVAVPFSVG